MIYKLPDGKFIDLSKVISIELEHKSYFGFCTVYCQLLEKPIYFEIQDDDNFYSNVGSREIQKKNIESIFNEIISKWKEVRGYD